ncbi:AMP-binding protein [Robbsia andropogonis]|uniref:AMP-binding protein n=1 Tax=Robbsia andropogonis TaxID=28092 RepID=UPI002A69A607|nr:AMP-binding protein [Robbsia andropogonis]
MNRLLPLHRVFCTTPIEEAQDRRASDAPRFRADTLLCFDKGAWLSHGDFVAAGRKVSAWARTTAQRPVPRVLIFLDDPFDFLCALFGTMAAGCRPVLPAHDAPAYWDTLAAADAYDVVLNADVYARILGAAADDERRAASDSDRAGERGTDVPRRSARAVRRPSDRPTVSTDGPIDPHAVLTLFTSGSTGAPKPLHKTLAQLDAEIQGFAAQWGDIFDEVICQSSVPHHHIYGLTFFLLWPLAAGRPFDRARCTGPGDWQALPPHWPPSRGTDHVASHFGRLIVSTPPQLSRWPALSGFDTSADTAVRCAFLSAGAPLPHETACAYLRTFGAAPFEIYGSTETGAIATRQQRLGDPDPYWTPLPGQAVWRTDAGTLAVRSPHLLAGNDPLMADEGFHTADAVSFVEHVDNGDGARDGGRVPARYFRLEGRIDRVAKVSGKRVSLPEIERALEVHPFVREVAAVTLTQADVRERERVGAVIVLRDAGSAVLFEQGRAAVVKPLRRHLSSHLDPVAVPHYWRFLSALPYDARGKLPAMQLRAVFAPSGTLPDVLSYASMPTSDGVVRWRYTLRVVASLVQFDGHFPIQPILPGVAQLDWAARFACRHVDALARVRSVEQLKFTAPIMPGTTLTLTLTHHASRSRVAFVFESEGRSCASGLLYYGDDDAAALALEATRQ